MTFFYKVLNQKTIDKFANLVLEKYEILENLFDFINQFEIADRIIYNPYTDRIEIKLQKFFNNINNNYNICLYIESFFDPIDFIENENKYIELINNFNKYLYYDNLKIELSKNKKEIIFKDLNDEKSNIEDSKKEVSGFLNIEIHQDIYNHIKRYLDVEDYFHAVSECYKVVREKLKEITGKEKATDAFSIENRKLILGYEPKNKAEEDFFDGVKFLNMAIQMFRNEKSHILANELDRSKAYNYISIANLSYLLLLEGQNKK